MNGHYSVRTDKRPPAPFVVFATKGDFFQHGRHLLAKFGPPYVKKKKIIYNIVNKYMIFNVPFDWREQTLKKGKTFKVCSTCVNFTIQSSKGKRKFFCSRLGYETEPHYSFNCWNPKREVRELMEKMKREGRL